MALDGIALVGNSNTVSSNDISSSDDAAVYIQGNNNTVFDNEFTGAAFGIFKISGSSGNNHYGNRYYATLVPVQDPAPQPSSERMLPSPVRDSGIDSLRFQAIDRPAAVVRIAPTRLVRSL